MRRLVAAFRARKRSALARAVSVVEGRRPEAEPLLRELLKVRPQARRLGLTGPPGAGKSSLAAGLASRMRNRGEEVAIVAVDPTSPFSGGALLGDRIRMNELAIDRGVFIRSMATRGSLGGIAAATREVVDLLDAFGFPNVLVETVGVGQTELEIASAVDTVAVVLVPESGDGIQAMKAGLMEIADIFVVNKSDRPGAGRLVRDLRLALELKAGRGLADLPAHHGVELVRRAGSDDSPAPAPEENKWHIPVLETSAGRNEGIDDLLQNVLAHHRHISGSAALDRRRKHRARQRIRDVVQRSVRSVANSALDAHPALPGWVSEVAAGQTTAYAVAGEICSDILKGNPKRDGG